jgi:hypothetical protein
MHSPEIYPAGYTNTFIFDVVEIPLNTSKIMKQVFDFSPEQFHAYLLQTVSAHECYRLSFHNDDHQRFTLNCPSKGILVDGHVVSSNAGTELYLSATSPICVISAEYEQRILADLLIQLHQTIHNPARPRTSFAQRHVFWLKGLRFHKKIALPITS